MGNTSKLKLANTGCWPVVTDRRETVDTIELTTVAGGTNQMRSICKVRLNDHDLTTEVIMVKNMRIASRYPKNPTEFQGKTYLWADQATAYSDVRAQILLCADRAVLHPVNVLDNKGEIIHVFVISKIQY